MAKETSFEHPPDGHVGLLVYDSVTKDWYAVLGDATGHIQLDVIGSALPDGAATALKQLANDHDVNVSNMISGFATSLKQLADGHGVVLGGDGLQLRRGDHTIADYDGVPGDTDAHDLVNVSGAGVLEWLGFGSDHASSNLYVTIDGDAVKLVDISEPSTAATLRAARLQYGNEETSLWRLVAYDAENDYYGIALKRPIWFNSSLLVRYLAGSATAKVSVTGGYHLF